MKKQIIILGLLFVLISTAALNAQTRIAVIPFTGGAGREGDTIARLISDELVNVSRSKYRVVPRTSAMSKVLEEQKFQRSGLTDADTIAQIGRGANAQYVVTGHIRSLGGKNLVVVTMTEVESLRQTAGAYKTYGDLGEIRKYLASISRTLVNGTTNINTKAPILAMLPFDIEAGNATANTDAEVLTHILACEIANTGKFSIVTRTSMVEQIMREQKIQRSGLTSSENVQKIGKAINAQFALAGYVANLGNLKLMGAQIIDIVSIEQEIGKSVEYNQISDGVELMAELSSQITGVKSENKVPTIAEIIALCNARAGQNRVNDIKNLLQTGNLEAEESQYDGTALILASRYGYTEIVKALILAEANLEAKNNDGSTALILASCEGQIEVAEALIAAGSNIEAKDNDGATALIWASYNGQIEIVKVLINAGANLEAKDNSGSTALTWASSYGQTEIANLLKAAGAK